LLQVAVDRTGPRSGLAELGLQEYTCYRGFTRRRKRGKQLPDVSEHAPATSRRGWFGAYFREPFQNLFQGNKSQDFGKEHNCGYGNIKTQPHMGKQAGL